jgi:hypothetical protein
MVFHYRFERFVRHFEWPDDVNTGGIRTVEIVLGVPYSRALTLDGPERGASLLREAYGTLVVQRKPPRYEFTVSLGGSYNAQFQSRHLRNLVSLLTPAIEAAFVPIPANDWFADPPEPIDPPPRGLTPGERADYASHAVLERSAMTWSFPRHQPYAHAAVAPAQSMPSFPDLSRELIRTLEKTDVKKIAIREKGRRVRYLSLHEQVR